MQRRNQKSATGAKVLGSWESPCPPTLQRRNRGRAPRQGSTLKTSARTVTWRRPYIGLSHLHLHLSRTQIITAAMESPGSDLSDYASDDFPEDVKGRQRSDMEPTPDQDSARPSKRLRLNQRAPSSPPPPITVPPLEDDDPLSEDTDGSVPASPNHHPGMSQDLDEFGQDQVTVCKWEGCEAGDLENMDNLVEHLHDDHIGTRQKKYSCEWSDCTRKGIPHASGYALRAHMRSHTREKPFYCTLPGMSSGATDSILKLTHARMRPLLYPLRRPC